MLSDQVLPKHVKEAYRLLNKSIIRVDQPEVHFEEGEEEEEAAAAAAAAAADEDAMEEGGESAAAAEHDAPKKQLRLSYEEYRAMANLMVHYLRKKEADAEEKGDDAQVSKADVVNWYLEEVAKDIDNQEELLERKQIVEKVIDRLAYQDNVLLPLNNKQGLKGAADDTDNPILVVHPNYVIDA